jgi:16S rRNA U516 pseudouridylate synthase RsuA-like enzyme
MVAAVGNRVEQLHRFRIGALELPEDLGRVNGVGCRRRKLTH